MFRFWAFVDCARVPTALFFADWHDEFAAAVPGGHTDLFEKKNNLVSHDYFVFFPIALILPLSFYLFPFFSSSPFIFPLFFAHFDLKLKRRKLA